MHPMIPRFTPRPTALPDHGFSVAPALPSIGAAQRASLGRGLSVVLMLAVSGLVLAYGPMVCRSSDTAAAEVGMSLPRDLRGATVRFAGPTVVRTVR